MGFKMDIVHMHKDFNPDSFLPMANVNNNANIYNITHRPYKTIGVQISLL